MFLVCENLPVMQLKRQNNCSAEHGDAEVKK